ncbi:right-handed parallel beta-helix repeat-containing protein [Candidatus Electronema sp. JM]|uniref:right-handed parallel beta-helix repeat-containing protein n=1 Tax=Candidatus Electronema sp. JM TaxID=3401571 RepID=UPI003AA81CAF
MSQAPLAFLSYANLDDQHEQGRLTQLRERLSGEVRMHTGQAFEIFQDRKDIVWGQPWEKRINDSLAATTFLLPIITPSFFNSAYCRDELERFLKREKELGRDDLILPVYYVNCLVLEDKEELKHDKLAQVIAARQYADWRELRYEEFSSQQVRKSLAKMAQQIAAALHRSKKESARAASVQSPTVIVDQKGRGDYATITDALKAVKAGTRILVRPGLYEESIVLDKPVEIIGDGNRDDIVIESSGKDVVLFQAKIGRIANLTLRQAGETGYGVSITKGRFEMEDCDISSQDRACVGIHDDADARLYHNRIHNGKTSGIIACFSGKGTLQDNEIIANAMYGIAIGMGGGNLTVRRNIITNNGKYGIWISDKGGGIFEDNDLRGNAEGAWLIDLGCEAHVQRSGNKE